MDWVVFLVATMLRSTEFKNAFSLGMALAGIADGLGSHCGDDNAAINAMQNASSLGMALEESHTK